MSSLNLTATEIISNVSKKLNLKNLRSTRETYGDFYIDGKYQFRVTMPNRHGGKNSLSTGWLKVCRDSVRLCAREYSDLVKCPMSGEDYNKIIRERYNIK